MSTPDGDATVGAAITIAQAVAHDAERGIDYLAYFDASFTLTVSARSADGSWTTVHPRQPLSDASGTQVGWRRVTLPENASDSHEELSLALDSRGALHLAGAVHNQPMLYWRVSSPGDLGSLEFRTELAGTAKWGFLVAFGLENTVSYPRFFTGGDGSLHLIFRNGMTSAGNEYIYNYDPATTTWSSATGLAPLWNGAESFTASPSAFGPYPTTPSWRDDADGGAYHVAWVWRGNDARNSGLSYAWSRDLVSWFPVDRTPANPGAPLTLPFQPAQPATLVDPGSFGGLVNGQIQLGFDYSNRIVITYPRNNARGETKLYAARPSGPANGPASVWRVSDLTATANLSQNVTGDPTESYVSSWSGAQTLTSNTMWHTEPVSLEDGRLVVRYACANPARGTVESRMFRASDTGTSGVTFGREDVFDTRPALAREITERDPATIRYSLATRTAASDPFVLRGTDGWGQDHFGERVRLVMRWEAGPFVADNVWPARSSYPAEGTLLRLFLVAAD
ncbi:BNR-4 repeat-containing protein [Leifsonia sp. EB41]|uniref:BNR-4 repeat-containing protein n=1 Tax=Leifsonia sp. EB41 TaxID=3156260 RepID=UPI0035172EA4